jgi:hypothetical protein
MIVRIFPAATIPPLLHNTNRPSRGKCSNSYMQIGCDNSNLAFATWSCFISFGCCLIVSPILGSINAINCFN